MAQLEIKDLIEAVKAHAKYSEWEAGVPAEKALYVRFGKADNVESDVLTLADGSELVLDKNDEGIVVGFEII